MQPSPRMQPSPQPSPTRAPATPPPPPLRLGHPHAPHHPASLHSAQPPSPRGDGAPRCRLGLAACRRAPGGAAPPEPGREVSGWVGRREGRERRRHAPPTARPPHARADAAACACAAPGTQRAQASPSCGSAWRLAGPAILGGFPRTPSAQTPYCAGWTRGVRPSNARCGGSSSATCSLRQAWQLTRWQCCAAAAPRCST